MVKTAVVQTSSTDGQSVVSAVCGLIAAEAAEGIEWPTPEGDAPGTRHEFFTRVNLSEAYNLVSMTL